MPPAAATRKRIRLIGAIAPVALLLASPSPADTPLDLNALILERCGAPGWGVNQGCRVRLGRDVYTLSETVRIGDCAIGTARNGLILEGESTGPQATVPEFPTAGTVLRWQGGPYPVISVCGSSRVSIRDLAIEAKGARTGVRIFADNTGAHVAHFTELRDLVIDGPDIGVYVGGRWANDQSDFVRLEKVTIREVAIGYDQDSQQSVGGRLETVEIVADRVAYRIRGGSLHCDGCYAGSSSDAISTFKAFHLTSSTLAGSGFSHQQVVIQNSHMELRTGRFIVDDAATPYPLTLIGNSYSVQCRTPGCVMRVIDSNGTGPVNIVGDVIQSNVPWARAQICAAGPVNQMGLVKKPEVQELVWGCD